MAGLARRASAEAVGRRRRRFYARGDMDEDRVAQLEKSLADALQLAQLAYDAT